MNNSIHRTRFNIVYDWLLSIMLMLFLLFILFFLSDNLFRLWLSLKSFSNNILYYIFQIFDVKSEIDGGINIQAVLDIKGGFDGFKILPVNFEVFKQEVITFFKSFINFSSYKDFFIYCLPFISNLAKILTLLLPFILLLYFLFTNYFEFDEDRDTSVPSKHYLRFIKFEDKIIIPIKEKLKDFYHYFIEENVHLKIFILLFLFSINGYTIVLDLLGWYLYFVSSFDLKSIYEILVTIFLDLGPFLVRVPTIVYLIIIYVIFDKIRCNKAYEKLERMEAYNMGFVNSLGSYTFIKGGPGSGKTLTMTYFNLCAEQILRERLFSIIKEINLEFPNFDFRLLENELEELVEKHCIFNHYQAKAWIEERRDIFFSNPNSNFFNYNFEKYNYEFNNGLFVEDLFEAISDYAQAYYLYSMNCPLSCANYSIRHNGELIFNGYFKMWSYDFLHENPETIDYSKNCKILDFNSLRIQKKLNSDKTNHYSLDGCVTSVTEIDKERRNQFYTNKLDKDDINANQLNDGYNDYGKMKRHDCTIRNKLIFMSFMDCQRDGSVNSDLVDINEFMITIHKQDTNFETSLFMYWLEPMIIESFLYFRNNIFYQFRLNRDDKTLLVYLLNKVSFYLNRYIVQRNNIFDFKETELDITNGVDDRKQKFFLLSKKIFARRYSTNCYSSFFEEKYLEAEKGFIDLSSYENYVPTIEELRHMNSYFVRDMDSLMNENTSGLINPDDHTDFTY